jgi:hypothetical protein
VRSLGLLVPLILVLMVAANGALTMLPRSIMGPGLSLSLSASRLLGLGIAGASAENAAPAAAAPLEAPHAGSAAGGLVTPELSPVEVPGAEDLSGEVVFGAGSASDDLLSSGSFQLAVPFHTQKDGDRFQGSNCGPASLKMVLDAFGTEQSNSDLRFVSHTYQGTVGYRGGTALQYVAMAARDFGLETEGLYDGASTSFHQWSIEDVRDELAAGRPVVPLVKYRMLPGHEGSTIRFDHYIVIYGMDGDRFLYHDPSFESPRDGAARWISAAQLNTAMRSSIVPGQAVAFGAGQLEALAASAVA